MAACPAAEDGAEAALSPELEDLQARLVALRDLRDRHGMTVKQVVFLRTYTLEGNSGPLAGCQFWQMYNTILPSLDEIQIRQRA